MSLLPRTPAEGEALKTALFNDSPNLPQPDACVRLLRAVGIDERTAREAATRAVQRTGAKALTLLTFELAGAALHDIADDLPRLLQERAVLADEQPPVPVDGDPPDGVRAHGADVIVGRGVKTDDKGRPYVYAWVAKRAHDFTMWCHDSAWYQYMYVTLILDGIDVTNRVHQKMQKHKIHIPTSNGSEMHFGEFGPDYNGHCGLWLLDAKTTYSQVPIAVVNVPPQCTA
jgi:hypothetical protein